MGKLDELEVTVAEVVDYLRITGQFAPALRQVITRKIAAETARERGIEVLDEELQKVADAFRHSIGLNKANDTEEWLTTHGVSLEALEDYLETNILMSALKDGLEQDTDKKKFMESPAIKESMRESIFQEWLAEKMKL